MPTKQRLRARADADELLNLRQAAELAGYASESLRKLMWPRGELPPLDPPPLEKHRGRWYVRRGELDRWLTERKRIA